MQNIRRIVQSRWPQFSCSCLAILLSMIAIFQTFGIGQCDLYCLEIAALPVSKPLSILALLFSGGQAYLIFNDRKRFRAWLSWIPVFVSVGTLTYLASIGTICTVCVSLALAFWASAFMGAKFWFVRLPGLFFASLSLVAILQSYFEHSNILPVQKSYEIERRDYEPAKSFGKTALVVFTDPLCPACKKLHRDLLSSGLKEPILYRWHFLPGNLTVSRNAALLIEAGFAQSRDTGTRLLNAIYGYEGQLDQNSLQTLAASFLTQEALTAALSSSNSEGLELLQDDGEVADRLHIESLPRLYVSFSSGIGELRETLTPISVELVLDGEISMEDRGHTTSTSKEKTK